MTSHSSHDSHGGESHAHGSFGTYMAVFGGLIVLTVLSFWIGNSGIKDEMPQAAWAGMMAVSCGKAMLVILFFMHLKWEANWKYVLTVPSVMMSLFLLCMLIPDVGMRRRVYSEERVIHAAEVQTHDTHSAGDAHGQDHDDHTDHAPPSGH